MELSEMISLIVAGVAGGIVRSIYFKEGWDGYARNVCAGGIAAYYLGPNAPEVAGFLLGDWTSGVNWRGSLELSGFIIGSGGVAIVGWAYDYIEAKLGKGKRNET